MNDFDLESRLKNVPLPERSEEYWENFPSQVRGQLRRKAAVQSVPEYLFSQFFWKMSFRVACLALGMIVLVQPLKAASSAIYKNEKIIRKQLAELPAHLRILMADEHGMHDLVAEKE